MSFGLSLSASLSQIANIPIFAEEYIHQAYRWWRNNIQFNRIFAYHRLFCYHTNRHTYDWSYFFSISENRKLREHYTSRRVYCTQELIRGTITFVCPQKIRVGIWHFVTRFNSKESISFSNFLSFLFKLCCLYLC